MPKHLPRKAQIAEQTTEDEIFVLASGWTDRVLAKKNELLAQWGMTTLQHNALKALYVYDRDGSGLSSSDIGSHLVTRVPDVTRLLDRLADKGWLVRERDANNRRIVRSRLTDIGVELVESAHTSLQRLERESLSALSDDDKETLRALLTSEKAHNDSVR